MARTRFNRQIFPIPGVVHSEKVRSGSHAQSQRIAVHQFALVLAVEINFDLASLRVVGRIAKNCDAGNQRSGQRSFTKFARIYTRGPRSNSASVFPACMNALS